MFDNNYVCAPKGIPFVAYYKTLVKDGEPFTHLHFHDDFEILYITEGSGEFCIAGETFVANENTALLVNPFETHSSKVIKAPLSYYCLDFSLEMLGMENTPNLMSEKIRYGNITKDKRVGEYVINACNAYFSTPCGWQNTVRGNLLLAFSVVENTLYINTEAGNTFVKDVILYVRENLKGRISSKTAAETFRYEHSYFCRRFKRNFFCTFGEYLNICRVEAAKTALINENVTAASENCGFSCSAAFSRIFKKYTGFTPSEYKSKLKGADYDL